MLFLKKKNNEKDLKAYCNGDLVSIDQVNDEVFSKKMMGDGIAIKPSDCEIYAPCDATVTVVFESTNHAVGLTTEDGLELLIHCGLDTVNLTEKVFDCKVKKGTKVKAGQLLITFDPEKLRQLKCEDIVMLVVLNPGKTSQVKFVGDCSVKAKETVVANVR